jgi:hypothetical protein
VLGGRLEQEQAVERERAFEFVVQAIGNGLQSQLMRLTASRKVCMAVEQLVQVQSVYSA